MTIQIRKYQTILNQKKPSNKGECEKCQHFTTFLVETFTS